MPNNDVPRGIDEKLDVFTAKVMEVSWAAYTRISQSLDCRRNRATPAPKGNQTHVERAVESKNTGTSKTL